MNDDGTLKIYDPVETKRFVREILENIEDKEFQQGGTFDTSTPNEDSAQKYEVLKHWSKYHPSKLKSEVLDDLDIYSEHSLEWTNDIRYAIWVTY